MRISHKRDLFDEVKLKLASQGLRVVNQDQNQPWGGSLLIDEAQAAEFARLYFNGVHKQAESQLLRLPLQPKILVVEPFKAISWQYHLRRAELWQVMVGEVGVVMSQNDEEGELLIKKSGALIRLDPGDRHRLIGLSNWAVIAQIWEHTDLLNPSDEGDVVRITKSA